MSQEVSVHGYFGSRCPTSHVFDSEVIPLFHVGFIVVLGGKASPAKSPCSGNKHCSIIIINTFYWCSLVIGLFQVQISALNNSDKYLSSVLENDIIVVGFDAVCRCPQVVLMLCLLEPRLNEHYLGHPIGFSLQSSCSWLSHMSQRKDWKYDEKRWPEDPCQAVFYDWKWMEIKELSCRPFTILIVTASPPPLREHSICDLRFNLFKTASYIFLLDHPPQLARSD